MSWKPPYVEPDQLADFMRVDDDQDDDQAELAIEAASRAVDRACARQFGRDDDETTRRYPAYRRNSGMIAAIDDVDDDVTITVDGSELDEGDYTLSPHNAAVDKWPFTHVTLDVDTCKRLEITARFGWEETPGAVEYATLLQATRFLQRRDAPFGISGSSDQGGEMRLLNKVNADVEVILSAYSRRRLPVG